MAGSVGTIRADALIEDVNKRLLFALAGANVAGAVVVFMFGVFLVPPPSGLRLTTGLPLNAAVFVAYMVVGVPLVGLSLNRLARTRLEWVALGRDPTDRERELTLRFPLVIQGVIAAAWALAAVVFAALNAPTSVELAGNIAIEIVLGGLVTCALEYLLAERLLRPLMALVLAGGVPRRPQLPGVAARALLSWTLGTGAVLLGVTLIAVGGLHERRFTAERISIAVLVLSVIGIVAGFLAMVALARSLAYPIDALRRAVGLVEQGELDHEVTVDDGSEVGLLQAGFNRMVAGLREREQLRDLFGRQVGQDVARRALEHGVELGGEALEAAVLFVDLQGSTRLAETRDPAEVVSLLNSFFAVVIEVVASQGGWVNKFEGDAALCVFGAPFPDPEASSHALAAARCLRDRLAAELAEIRAGIGVSAGRAVAGNIGAATRFEYTVIGDPVNEAARLTELAKTRSEGVLASEAALTGAAQEEASQWQVCGAVQLRGRSEPSSIAVPVASES